MKGGVGKTTTTVSLAETLAANQHAVLVIDLDAQGNASMSIAGQRIFSQIKSLRLMLEDYLQGNLLEKNKNPIESFIRKAVSSVYQGDRQLDVSLIAASPQLRLAERQMIVDFTEAGYGWRAIEGQVTSFLSKDLSKLRNKFDYIIFDCAPGISAFTEVAIRLSDLVIVPSIPDYISTQGVFAFTSSLFGASKSGSALPQHQRKPWVLATRVRSNVNHHQEYLRLLREAAAGDEPPFAIFETTMPEMIRVPDGIRQVETFEQTGRTTYQQKWGTFAVYVQDLGEEVGRELNERDIQH